MSLLIYKYIAGIIIFAVTLIAIIYPIRAHARSAHNHFLDFGDAFASGVFLGAALFHMLPESAANFHELLPNIHYPLAALFCATGFLILLFLERLTVSTTKNKNHHKVTIPYVLGIVIILHSLIEGAVLGINTDLATGFLIFLAILAHKGSEGFALSITLARSNLSFIVLFIFLGVFALTTPLGIALGTTAETVLQARQGQFFTAIFSAFAAGTFLYMSTLHHISHHQRMHEAENLQEYVCLMLGVIVMGVIALWV
ncbi:MAG: ZIP family transporter [Gammaproteobacteria bacterium]